MVFWKLSSPRRCFVNSVLMTPPWWWRTCCMLNCEIADQLSTSWILDGSRYLPLGLKRNKNIRIYCRMPSFLKNSIYQLILFAVWWDFFPPVHALWRSLFWQSCIVFRCVQGFARNWKRWRDIICWKQLFFEVKVVGDETGFHWIRIQKSGGDTGQTWVVRLEPVFF